MAITVTAPDAFYEREPWAFTLTIQQPNGVGPMVLTGSRLFVQFQDWRGTVVGACDSAASDGSLTLVDPVQGECSFVIPSGSRAWRAPRTGRLPGLPSRPVRITGDLYRYPQGSSEPEGVCTIAFDVIPSTGLPTP